MSKSEKRNGGEHPDVRVDANIEWNQINWQHAEKVIARLQARIVKAQQEGRFGKVRSLTRILTRSMAAKALAVKKVTSNKGGRTPGVDGETWRTNEQKAQAISEINQDNYRAKPLRRKYIPKKNGKLRPLGIPTMKDRALQAVHNMALSPVAETTADPNSYGFRPYRCCQDAIEQIGIIMCKEIRPQWVLEGDIKGCFDNINHEWVMQNIPMEKKILNQWLKSGYLEGDVFHETDAGTPQGGIISPVLANMVLDGLEKMLNARYKTPRSRNGKTRWNPKPGMEKLKLHFVRYADDFIITGSSKEFLEAEIKPLVSQFMAERGLDLSEEKTIVTHIEEGFDFLGFNIRTRKGKLSITPAKDRVKKFEAKIGEVIRNNPAVTAYFLIRKLNPMLRGWSNFYRHESHDEACHYLSHRIWEKLWHWACKRHPGKNKGWIKNKYFTSTATRGWIFFGTSPEGNKEKLFDMTSVPQECHIKITSGMNPYASEDREYFETRKRRRNIRNR